MTEKLLINILTLIVQDKHLSKFDYAYLKQDLLKNRYLPLWAYLDSLIIIKPEDYNYCLQWRIEAEHKLIGAGKTGMSDQEITRFVEYFWKALHPELFMPRMISDRAFVDLVIEISRSHLPVRIYRP